MKSDLYYEVHVTIDLVFDGQRELAHRIAARHRFRLAELIMRKRSTDTEQESQDDTFMTGHGTELSDMLRRTTSLVRELKAEGFVVRRYKLEDTLLDSRQSDALALLDSA